jgi:hypothetical protein
VPTTFVIIREGTRGASEADREDRMLHDKGERECRSVEGEGERGMGKTGQAKAWIKFWVYCPDHSASKFENPTMILLVLVFNYNN